MKENKGKNTQVVPVSKMESSKLYFNKSDAKFYRKIKEDLEVLNKEWTKVKLNINILNILNNLELREY